PALPVLYTLSLHDALPISRFAGVKDEPRAGFALNIRRVATAEFLAQPHLVRIAMDKRQAMEPAVVLSKINGAPIGEERHRQPGRSEEHTSELQSLAYLVCR